MDVFDRNDRKAIEAALNDPDPTNPIATDVANRIEEFTQSLTRLAKPKGKWPTELLLTRPETEFDAIVIRLTLKTIADQLGQRIEIHWIPK